MACASCPPGPAHRPLTPLPRHCAPLPITGHDEWEDRSGRWSSPQNLAGGLGPLACRAAGDLPEAKQDAVKRELYHHLGAPSPGTHPAAVHASSGEQGGDLRGASWGSPSTSASPGIGVATTEASVPGSCPGQSSAPAQQCASWRCATSRGNQQCGVQRCQLVPAGPTAPRPQCGSGQCGCRPAATVVQRQHCAASWHATISPCSASLPAETVPNSNQELNSSVAHSPSVVGGAEATAPVPGSLREEAVYSPCKVAADRTRAAATGSFHEPDWAELDCSLAAAEQAATASPLQWGSSDSEDFPDSLVVSEDEKTKVAQALARCLGLPPPSLSPPADGISMTTQDSGRKTSAPGGGYGTEGAAVVQVPHLQKNNTELNGGPVLGQGEGGGAVNERKARRLESNRASAKRCRERKVGRLQELEEVTAKLEQEQGELLRCLRESEADVHNQQQLHAQLRKELQGLRALLGGEGGGASSNARPKGAAESMLVQEEGCKRLRTSTKHHI